MHQVQHPINAKPQQTLFAARFEVNVTGALVKRILQQPVNNIDDVLIFAITGTGTELNQLFKITDRTGFFAFVGHTAD